MASHCHRLHRCLHRIQGRRYSKKNLNREHLIEYAGTSNILRALCLTRSLRSINPLLFTHDFSNDDNAPEIEEIVDLEVSPTLDGENASGKKKFVVKTSTTEVSKKSRAIVTSVVVTRSATVEDTMMSEADSKPLLLIQSRAKISTPPSPSQHLFLE